MSNIDETVLTKLESSQWRERGDALDSIARHVNSPSLSSATCGLVVKGLLQVIGSDKHRALVTKAATILNQLVDQLQSDFSPHAERSLRVLLAKFKETQHSVVQSLSAASRSVLETLSLESSIALLQTGLSSPSASIQSEATELLAHCLCIHCPDSSHHDTLTQAQRVRLAKPLIPVLHKISQHRDSACRDASFRAFASIQLFLAVDAHHMDALTEGILDPQRRSKVDMAVEALRTVIVERNAKLKSRQKSKDKELRKKSRASVKGPDNLPADTPDDSSVTPPKRHVLRERNASVAAAATTTTTSTGASVAANKMKSTQASARPPRSSKSARASKAQCSVQSTGTVLSFQEVNEALADFFLRTPVDQLWDADWKVRLVAAESLRSKVTSTLDIPECTLNLIVQFLLHTERLHDINLQVRSHLLDALAVVLHTLSQHNSALQDRLIQSLCKELIPSLADSKVNKVAQKALNGVLLTSACSSLFLTQFNAQLEQTKNPTVHAAALEWISTTINESDIFFDLDQIAQLIKHGLRSTNGPVRQCAINLAGTVHMCPWNTGNRLRALLANEKPALVNRLSEEFGRRELDAQRPSVCPSSSSSSAGAVNHTRADATFACGTGHPNDMDITRVSGTTDEMEDTRLGSLDKNIPKKGCIKPVTGPLMQPANQATSVCLFSAQSTQVAELMEAKERRLSQLTKSSCIDLARLRATFTELRANPTVLNALFSPSGVPKLLETLDLLTGILDDTGHGGGPSAVVLTYAHFDLLLAWTIGTCFAYDLSHESDTRSRPRVAASWTDQCALIARGLQYLSVVISRFAQAEFQLSEQEVTLLLDALLSDQEPSIRATLSHRTADKTCPGAGSLDPILHDAISSLIRLLRQVYPASSLIDPMAGLLHQSNNTTGRLICLQELVSLVPHFENIRGLNMNFSLKVVAQQLADPNPIVRQLALEYLQLAHRLLGSEFWNRLDHLRVSDRKMLQQHLGFNAPMDDHGVGESTVTGNTTQLNPHPSRSESIPTITKLSVTVDMSSYRENSPPPPHRSPAAVSILLPLLHERNNSMASADSKASANEQLHYALTCLVNQLDAVELERGKSNSSDQANSEPSGAISREEADMDDIDEADVFSSVVVGALVDLETLIMDPRTIDLLVPFVNSIVCRLASLLHALSTVPNPTAGHMVFLNCVVGLVVVIFEQPFLAREAGDDALLSLLSTAFRLASRDQVQFTRLCATPRRSVLLRLVGFLVRHVGTSCALRILLRLLSITTFGADCARLPESSDSDRRKSARQKRIEPVHDADPLLHSCANSLQIRDLVIAQLYPLIEVINTEGPQIDWSSIAPLFESMLIRMSHLDSRNTRQTRNKRRSSSCAPEQDLTRTTDLCIHAMLIAFYARLGSAFAEEVNKIMGSKSALSDYLARLGQQMPNAPYSHCLAG